MLYQILLLSFGSFKCNNPPSNFLYVYIIYVVTDGPFGLVFTNKLETRLLPLQKDDEYLYLYYCYGFICKCPFSNFIPEVKEKRSIFSSYSMRSKVMKFWIQSRSEYKIYLKVSHS